MDLSQLFASEGNASLLSKLDSHRIRALVLQNLSLHLEMITRQFNLLLCKPQLFVPEIASRRCFHTLDTIGKPRCALSYRLNHLRTWTPSGCSLCLFANACSATVTSVNRSCVLECTVLRLLCLYRLLDNLGRFRRIYQSKVEIQFWNRECFGFSNSLRICLIRCHPRSNQFCTDPISHDVQVPCLYQRYPGIAPWIRFGL